MHGSLTKIGVIVATCDRPFLLSSRSIPSILNQSVCPDYIIIVDDSRDNSNKSKNESYIQSLQELGVPVTLICNRRTRGASGAWNTGIDWVFEQTVDSENTFIAILDDDDSWNSKYLEKCLKKCKYEDFDMVAADISRFIDTQEKPHIGLGVDELNEGDFLIGNPGIQASNIFIRLATILEAGCFDEALRSCTDRDMCIRLTDLCSVHFGRLPEVLVNHYAESDRERLTTKGSQSKISGLDSFWRKYSGRMDDNQIHAFHERSKLLFGWTPPIINQVSYQDVNSDQLQYMHSYATPWVAPEAPNSTPFHVVIGVITSEPKTVLPLIQSVAALHMDTKIILLDNGCLIDELEMMDFEVSKLDIDLMVIGQVQQQTDAENGLFGQLFSHRPPGMVGIAQARTMIQRYLGREITGDTTAIGWLLDDDMRVDIRAQSYLRWLPILRDSGIDVIIGAYEGSSPNPPINGLRVQLVDLVHNIRWLERLPKEQLLPNRSAENNLARMEYPDYYYDLSRKHSAHLEMPQWIEPISIAETVEEAQLRILRMANSLLDGIPITRPLTVNTPVNPLKEVKDSVNRGGTTFILNPDTLNLTPNITARIHGHEARRSDMIWAILNRNYRGYTVKSVGFPVNHVARTPTSTDLNIVKIQGEILGSAMYAGITDFLSEYPKHNLNFSKEELVDVENLCTKHLYLRLTTLKKNLYRIRGLTNALRSIDTEQNLQPLLNQLEQCVSADNWNTILIGATALSSSELCDFLNSLRDFADDYAMSNI